MSSNFWSAFVGGDSPSYASLQVNDEQQNYARVLGEINNIWYELSAKCVFPQVRQEAWRKIGILYL